MLVWSGLVRSGVERGLISLTGSWQFGRARWPRVVPTCRTTTREVVTALRSVNSQDKVGTMIKFVYFDKKLICQQPCRTCFHLMSWYHSVLYLMDWVFIWIATGGWYNSYLNPINRFQKSDGLVILFLSDIWVDEFTFYPTPGSGLGCWTEYLVRCHLGYFDVAGENIW